MSPELTRNAQKSILEGKPTPVSAQIFNFNTSKTRLAEIIHRLATTQNRIFNISSLYKRDKSGAETGLNAGQELLNNQKGQFLRYSETFNLRNVLQIRMIFNNMSITTNSQV